MGGTSSRSPNRIQPESDVSLHLWFAFLTLLVGIEESGVPSRSLFHEGLSTESLGYQSRVPSGVVLHRYVLMLCFERCVSPQCASEARLPAFIKKGIAWKRVLDGPNLEGLCCGQVLPLPSYLFTVLRRAGLIS